MKGEFPLSTPKVHRDELSIDELNTYIFINVPRKKGIAVINKARRLKGRIDGWYQ